MSRVHEQTLPQRADEQLRTGVLTWRYRETWALNSAVECHLHTVEVIGSNPIAPTISCLETPA